MGLWFTFINYLCNVISKLSSDVFLQTPLKSTFLKNHLSQTSIVWKSDTRVWRFGTFDAESEICKSPIVT